MLEANALLITAFGFFSLFAMVIWLSFRHHLAANTSVAANPSANLTASPGAGTSTKASNRAPKVSAPMPHWVLLAEDGPMRGKRFELHSSHLTIGRDPARCHIHYAGEAVSREHAKIQPLAQGARLWHLSGTNKTFVNGKAVQDAHLSSGDRIRISQVTFRLEQG